MIKLNGVSYSYEGRTALADVNIVIHSGEAVSLLGANGSGKSTLLKLLNGLIEPDSGWYRFDGEEITRKRLANSTFSKRFHQRIGFVFQNSDTQLFCASVFEEIAFGPRQMGLSEDEAQARVADCLRLLGLEGFEGRVPYHLSGGEKKKVALACALALNPEVLALDEPTSGLDPRTERWLAEFLHGLSKTGKTLIISTHNLELVQEITNRAILFAEDHTIAADLDTRRLFDDIDLLKRVNLVDQYYHKHSDGGHTHFHIHNY